MVKRAAGKVGRQSCGQEGRCLYLALVRRVVWWVTSVVYDPWDAALPAMHACDKQG